jgi:hypothetical protein
VLLGPHEIEEEEEEEMDWARWGGRSHMNRSLARTSKENNPLERWEDNIF